MGAGKSECNYMIYLLSPYMKWKGIFKEKYLNHIHEGATPFHCVLLHFKLWYSIGLILSSIYRLKLPRTLILGTIYLCIIYVSLYYSSYYNTCNCQLKLIIQGFLNSSKKDFIKYIGLDTQNITKHGVNKDATDIKK